MRRWLISILATALLAACATPTVFGPAARPGGVGYAETHIERERWRVTFQGGSDASSQRVADLALLRAAQLTLEQGYDWFRVTDRQDEASPPRGPVLSVGGGSESYGPHGGSGFGVGVGGIPLGGGPLISETIEIVMGKGEPPREVDVYDAHGVVQSIRP